MKNQPVDPELMDLMEERKNKHTVMILTYIFAGIPTLALISFFTFMSLQNTIFLIWFLIALIVIVPLSIIVFTSHESYLEARKKERMLANDIAWRQHLDEQNKINDILRENNLL